MKIPTAFCILTLIFAASCKNENPKEPTMSVEPPIAEKRDKVLEIHDDMRIDPYYWLNERENEEVIDYLERENDYYEK